MLLKHLAHSAVSPWSKVGYQDDLLLNKGYNTGQMICEYPSQLPGYPWSSRSPNDLRGGSSTRGSSPERVPQMRSVIFDLASWPPTDGGRGQEWSDPPTTLPRLDLEILASIVGEGGWSRIPTPHHPALPTHPPPTQRPSLRGESLSR